MVKILVNEYHLSAFLLVCLHDFLDHLDGIVAKVQKKIYGPVDDPLLGGFMDAFCDKEKIDVNRTCMPFICYVRCPSKIVNVISLWTILMVTDFSTMSLQGLVLYVMSCVIIITYEFVLGVVRVQDYFRAYYASVSISKTFAFVAGIIGITCLLLSVRLAHASLQHKLKARKHHKSQEILVHMATINYHDDKDYSDKPLYNEDGSKRIYEDVKLSITKSDQSVLSQSNDSQKALFYRDNSENSEESDEESRPIKFMRSHSVPFNDFDGRVDKVYTIGCFDLFHKGHVRLLQRMRSLGKQRVPIDSTEKRMLNVKQYADIVFCIAGKDPSNFVTCITYIAKDESTLYVRGDDMPNFPSRTLVESLMPVRLLPYTQGVSTTQLRKKWYNHIKNDEDINNEIY
ncbi:hypothetical protein KUTeg_019883 [Tegillarca granosa]|uniref:Cytidyltransferase-like domain-containing protein n=1 Tax=Tegillarca granosa TaxID=220873 RepID=A0ABQ9EDV0_TEGGR|nr:hypothetical protein KUTeg_019883 [Tegillarca granosa]